MYLHSFLHSILAEGEWLASSSIRLTPDEKGTVYSRPQYDLLFLGKFCTAESCGLNTITVFIFTANVHQTFSGLLHWSPSLPCSTYVSSASWNVFIRSQTRECKCIFHCFTVHFDSLSFIHNNSCNFSYKYVSVF